MQVKQNITNILNLNKSQPGNIDVTNTAHILKHTPFYCLEFTLPPVAHMPCLCHKPGSKQFKPCLCFDHATDLSAPLPISLHFLYPKKL